MRQEQKRRVLVASGEGDLAEEGPSSAIIKVYGEETGGLVSVIENPLEPGVLIPPHVHEKEDVMAYILTGEVWFRVGEDVVRATEGSYVLKPRGIPHVFWNAGPAPANFIEIFTPAGFEHIFEEFGRRRREGKTLDFDAVKEIGQPYGWIPFTDWVSGIEGTYNVRLVW